MRRSAALLVLPLLLGIPAGGYADPPEIEVQHPSGAAPSAVGVRESTVYMTTVDGVRGELRFIPPDATLLFKTAGSASPAAQAALLAPLLHRMLADNPDLPRLSLFLADRDVLVDRLAGVLAACKGWNRTLGKPVHGEIRHFIIDTMNAEDVARELVQVFEAEGYALSVQAAAMISVAPSPAHDGAMLPSDVAYLGFVADREPARGRPAPWPRPYRHSTC